MITYFSHIQAVVVRAAAGGLCTPNSESQSTLLQWTETQPDLHSTSVFYVEAGPGSISTGHNLTLTEWTAKFSTVSILTSSGEKSC